FGPHLLASLELQPCGLVERLRHGPRTRLSRVSKQCSDRQPESTGNHRRQRPARLSIDGRTRLGHSLERCIRITGECLASLIQVPEGFPRLLTRSTLTAHPPCNSRQGFHQCGPVLQELFIAPCERNSGQGIWHTPQANGVCLRVVDNSLPVD